MLYSLFHGVVSHVVPLYQILYQLAPAISDFVAKEGWRVAHKKSDCQSCVVQNTLVSTVRSPTDS